MCFGHECEARSAHRPAELRGPGSEFHLGIQVPFDQGIIDRVLGALERRGLFLESSERCLEVGARDRDFEGSPAAPGLRLPWGGTGQGGEDAGTRYKRITDLEGVRLLIISPDLVLPEQVRRLRPGGTYGMVEKNCLIADLRSGPTILEHKNRNHIGEVSRLIEVARRRDL